MTLHWKLPPESTSIIPFSLKYPVSAGWKSLGLSAVLAFFAAVLIVPIVVLWGYRYRISRAGARGDDRAPELDDFGSIIWNGLLLIGAFLPYAVIAAISTFALLPIAGLVESPVPILFVIAWLISVTYAGLAIHPTFVATGSINDTYSGLLFLKVATTREYLVGFLIGFVLRLLVMMVTFLLFVVSIITLIGPFIVLTVWYAYDEFVPGALWGHVAYKLSRKDILPPVEAETNLDL